MAINERVLPAKTRLVEVAKSRQLKGWLRIWSRGMLLFIGVSGLLFAIRLHALLRYAMWKEQYMGVVLGVVLASVFLLVPRSKAGPWDRVPWYDFLFHCLSLIIGIYTWYRIPDLMLKECSYNPVDTVVGIVVVLLILETIRRIVGKILLVLSLVFLLYMLFGNLVPGVLVGVTFPWDHAMADIYFNVDAILGLTLLIVISIIVVFFILAEVLMALGGHDFLVDFAGGIAGGYRGGPAKVAVIASSLFGTISGSAVANVVFTGSMTIPMMKKAGYPPHVAAAIEGAASTGGQVMPPMMGVTAFLIASFIGVKYAIVCIAAAIPAILYYASLFLQTDLEAAKSNIRGLPPGEYPPLRQTMKRAYLFIVPLLALFYFLFFQWLDPDIGGAYAVMVTVAMGLVVKWRGLAMIKSIPIIFENAGRRLLDIIVISLVAGIVMGVLAQSGLGTTFGMIVVNIGADYGLFLMLMLVAAVATFLGMGMPTPIVYIFLATLIGAGLVDAGLPRLGSHLFILYFGLMSMVTPPVCLAAFAAAAIAGASFLRTGWRAMRFAIAAFIVPFIFIYQPALLMQGAPADIIAAFLLTLMIVTSASIVMTRHSLFAHINWLESLILVLIGGGLIYALIYASHIIWWPALIVGGGIIVGVLLKGKVWARPKPVYEAEEQPTLQSDSAPPDSGGR